MAYLNRIENQTFDAERALYDSKNVEIVNCRFDGPADGESALKESREFSVKDCYFNLRYPFWHDDYLKISGSELTPLCRAALWYTSHADITDTKLHGIKALRECTDISLTNCDVDSTEFGWSVHNCRMDNVTAKGEYFMMRSSQLNFHKLTLNGKYSFQYVQGGTLSDCVLNTKDAFWHSENVTVTDSIVNGEYLGWYSNHLTLIRCKISGTQPLCYCKNLTLIDCEMIGTDLSFERSEVEAMLTAPIESIKNPRHGTIRVPAVGEIIMDDPAAEGVVLTDK